MDNNTGNWVTTASVTAVIAGLVVGLLLGYWWGSAAVVDDHYDDDTMMEEYNNDVMADKKGDDAMKKGDDVMIKDNNTAEAADGVVVADQAVGAVVTVDSVAIDAPAWVAVAEVEGGVVMSVLGAQRVDAGVSEDVEITLLRPTVEGESYAIVTYVDNGDGEFSLTTDPIVSLNDDAFTATGDEVAIEDSSDEVDSEAEETTEV